MVDDPRPGPETSRWLLGRAPWFARLWAAKAISHLGDGAAVVALVVYVQQTQGRAWPSRRCCLPPRCPPCWARWPAPWSTGSSSVA